MKKTLMILAICAPYPRACAALSSPSLLDSLNCVRLSPGDWWFPAAVAVLAAVCIRTPDPRP